MPKTKVCTKCGKRKKLGEYYAKKAECKICFNMRISAHRIANRERDRKKHTARNAAYRRTPAGRLVAARARAKYDASHRDKNRERSRRWHAANRERARAAQRAWRVANKERLQAYDQRRYVENKEAEAARHRKWVAQNRDWVNLRNQQYRILRGGI